MFEFSLPDLGEGIHEGELVKWHVKTGDGVKEDDPLCDVETDKATVTIPSPRSGTVVELNGEPGETIMVGSILLVIDDGGAVAVPKAPSEPESKKENAATATGSSKEQKGDSSLWKPASGKAGKKAVAAPATRRVARERGIDINQVPGTGPGGRVTREDLDRFESDPRPSEAEQPENVAHEEELTGETIPVGAMGTGIPFFEPANLPDFETQGPVEREPIRSLRKKTAQKTTTSMIVIPHVAHMDECDVTELEILRKEFNKKHPDEAKLTLMGFIIKSAVSLLRQFPMFNASIDPRRMEIIYKHYYNIGFAADTPKGLMVPVIKGADQYPITGMAKEIRRLAEKGRDGSITLAELSQGTFTVTNVGAIGGTGVIPTINYPESAILGLGRVDKKPVVKDQEIVIRTILPMTLSFDHRVADGAQAARFMTQLKQMLEDPFDLMVGI